MTSEPTGILLLDKPQGWTSHDVVARVRRWYGTRKVGHAGTLDPMATGLLVLGLGKGTKLLTWLVGADKTYTATIRLGSSTPTDDADSAADVWSDPAMVAALDAAAIDDALVAFLGDIAQVPSSVSAIKVEGRRSYARVRAGESVELAARPVHLSGFERTAEPRAAEDSGRPYLDVQVLVSCSSGTYVRALARDLGRALGVHGHLTALRRTRVGGFTVDGVPLVPDREAAPEPLPLLGLSGAAGAVMERRELSLAEARSLGFGQRIAPSGRPASVAGLLGGELVAVLEDRDGQAASATVFLTPEQLPSVDSSNSTN